MNKGKEFFGVGTPIVNFTDVFHNRGIYANQLKGKVNLERTEINNYEVKKGDIFFTRTSEIIDEIGYPSVMLDEPENTVFSGFVLRGRSIQPNDPLDDFFKKYVFYTDAFREEMTKKSSMTTRALTSGTSIKGMRFQFPSSKKEQHKIGKYLTTLDNLITLHQRKLCILYILERLLYENIKQFETTISWEQRKLGDIYGSIGNAFVGTATPYYAEQGHFYLESNNVKDGQINHNSEVFINDEFYEKQKDKWLHTGDMVMVQSGHVGHAAVIPEELDNTAAHALIMFRNPKEEIEPYFLNYEYQTDKAKKKIENITTGNTIKHILASDMQEFVVDVPKYEEQKVIAGYFRNLDHLITLHQRKYDKLQNLKKAMLEKMFPKNGSNVPEIRFKGFTDAWEQRKLDDVAEFGKGNGYSKGDLIESGTPIILYGRLYTKYETRIFDVDTYVEAKEGSVYSKGGEVIVPASGETAEDIARAATVDKSGILIGGDLNVVMPNKDIDSAFLAISISNGNPQRELAKKAQGKSVVHIHNEEIRNLTVPFPTKVEQNKIVDYFNNLDNLITLHQRELEKLQNIKKAMLEKMFV